MEVHHTFDGQGNVLFAIALQKLANFYVIRREERGTKFPGHVGLIVCLPSPHEPAQPVILFE